MSEWGFHDRVSIAMWDFSWMYMHYPGGAFEDFDSCLAQLVERGFNAVRIDAFPAIVGRLASLDEQITVDGDPLRNWGPSDEDRYHRVVEELLEFMRAARDHSVAVVLSTWNFSCREHPDLRSYYAADRAKYWDGWERVLDVLREHGLLDHVLYVDLDQEFPFFSPTSARIDELGGRTSQSSNDMEQAGTSSDHSWNRAQRDFVREHIESSLAHFQSIYPGLRFTFSFTEFWSEVRSLGIRSFDVLELHIWMTQSARFVNRTGFGSLAKDRDEHDYSEYMRRVRETMRSMRPMLLKEMHKRLGFARDWAADVSAPLTTTEAWGPWWHMDHPDLEWGWLRDWCEECMQLSSEYGFWGSTPWNFSHPYWKNWEDVSWYRRVNQRFLQGSGATRDGTTDGDSASRI
jgi:hypothetical protein